VLLPSDSALKEILLSHLRIAQNPALIGVVQHGAAVTFGDITRKGFRAKERIDFTEHHLARSRTAELLSFNHIERVVDAQAGDVVGRAFKSAAKRADVPFIKPSMSDYDIGSEEIGSEVGELSSAFKFRTSVLAPALERLPRIARVSRLNAPSSIIRGERLALAAERRNWLAARSLSGNQVSSIRKENLFDSILLQRNGANAEQIEHLLQVAKVSGARLVFELDDDLISTGAVHRLTTTDSYQKTNLAALRRFAQSADQVIVSTDRLSEVVRSEIGVEPAVFPNQLDPALWMSPIENELRNDRFLRLLYFGTATHAADLALLDGVIERVSKRIGREVRLDVLGVTSGKLPKGAFRLKPPVSRYEDFVYWIRMNRQRWIAGIAPLVDDQLNASKSDLKLLEYGALGLPALASKVGPYQNADELAMLVDTRAGRKGWIEALCELLSDRAAARKFGRVSRERVLSERVFNDQSVGEWGRLILGSQVRQAND